ncbi:hypothetical protein COW38_01380 [Candidatus Collierbacteria bacterium CG17_big_fil_post_rev_8_21_14_2_50_45_7]|uniref:Integrase catalytic domain-containing protein n=2 Tax=Bacteria candidate phyla TaxID=1783234 RepID=A0A2M7FR43_9BACT|nr:MAG: hypothetical protein COW38_01380 [Candidatus Collierbacteria bacterium CG17_big_fil_post_rev_8_21_14_2_50_45_7]
MKGTAYPRMIATAVGVSTKSKYYVSIQEQKDQLLKTDIESLHLVHPAYGHKRVAMALLLGHNRVSRVMNKYGIKPPRRKAKKYFTTKSTTDHSYTNLIKNIVSAQTNEIWVTDLTYIKFHGSFVYLSTVKDIFTREILSSRMSNHHDADLVLTCIKGAIAQTGTVPTYFHSDQGNENMAKSCTSYLEGLGVKVSVSDKGSPWQNPYQESFFGRFKEENGDLERFESVGELSEEIYSYMYYYNNFRIHTALGMPPKKYLDSHS